ncbi:MAG: PqqD family protein [Rhodothermales bacterium]|nr:PqqD family protein [Rhodothermales bacterium]
MPLPKTPVVTTDGLSAAQLGDEAIVLNVHTGQYYSLNELGARILDIAETPTAPDDIVRALLCEYDVEEDVLRADVLAFLEDLQRNGLIVTLDEADG